MNTDIGATAERPRPGIAAFDFDGTLVRRDTLVPFLARLSGRRRLAAALAAQGRRYRRDRDAAKLDVLRRLTTGIAQERLEELGRDYSVGLHHLLQPDTVARLRWHRTAGHHLLVVSASLGAYLRPLGATLGLDDVIAVELEADDAGRCTGEVRGGVNVNGAEKARALRAWIGAHLPDGVVPEIWAYGDTAGDTELLAMADHPCWVGTYRGD